MMARIGYGDYPDLSHVARVLVVKLRQHGDVLLTSPLYRVLRRALPAARIGAYVYRDTAPMLDGHPDIDTLHVYDRSPGLGAGRRVAHELSVMREIRRAKYDLVINLTEGDRGAATAWLAGARYRIGIDPQGSGLLFKSRLYTHVVKRCRTPRHMVEQQLDALRRIGIFPGPEERDLLFVVPPAARAAVDDELRASGMRRGEFVLVHPASRWLFKCWPAPLVAELIRHLHRGGTRVALSAAPDPRERAMIDEIVAGCPGVPVLNLAGRLTLKELGGWIEASRCLVSVDSVPMHIASALKHPVVALFGPSSDRTWGPWRNPHGRVVSVDYSCRPCGLDGCGGSKVSDCLHVIPVETVLEQLRLLVGVPA